MLQMIYCFKPNFESQLFKKVYFLFGILKTLTEFYLLFFTFTEQCLLLLFVLQLFQVNFESFFSRYEYINFFGEKDAFLSPSKRQ